MTVHDSNLVTALAGEWWKSDVEAVIDEAMKSGGAPNVSDAHTINGRPGPVANCPKGTKKEEQTQILRVRRHRRRNLTDFDHAQENTN